MKRLLFMLWVGIGLGGWTSHATPEPSYLVLGVIASSAKQSGVALIKDENAKKTFAVKVGGTLDSKIGSTLLRVSRKSVDIAINGQTYRFSVGDRVVTNQIAHAKTSPGALAELEKKDGLVKISTAYKDHLVKEQLGTILMQAATVPYYQNDRLAGFTFWDIEKDSIFERIGIKDGDTITSINQNRINDVGSTIRLLHNLKLDAKEVSLTYLRSGMEQETRIVID